jgi:hypothetical protein
MKIGRWKVCVLGFRDVLGTGIPEELPVLPREGEDELDPLLPEV